MNTPVETAGSVEEQRVCCLAPALALVVGVLPERLRLCPLFPGYIRGWSRYSSPATEGCG